MHNRDKYPEIWAAFERSKARKEELVAKRKLERDKMNPIFAQIEELQSQLQPLSIAAQEDIVEIKAVSSEISRLARAMGAESLGADSVVDLSGGA